MTSSGVFTQPAWDAPLGVAQTPSEVVDYFLARFAPASALFFEEVLHIDPLKWQRQACAWYDARERRIAVKSGHGVGKGWLIAGLAVHHMLTRFPQKTVITAPSAGQLYDAAWNDIKIFISRLPKLLSDMIEVKSDRIEMKDAVNESFMSAKTSRADTPEALQGVRSEGSTLLLCDEASGIPDAVFEASTGSMSHPNVTMLLTGNPIRVSGMFYDVFHRLAAQWKTLTVSCLDVPHISEDYITDCRIKYGEDSARYAYRVLGEFPAAEEDTVIGHEVVEMARFRDVLPPPTAPVVWGLDCARTGADRSALAKRQQNVLLESVKTYRIPDTMTLTGRIIAEFKSTPSNMRPAEICVDVIGIGAGVVDRLRELSHELPGCAIRGVNVSESPAMQTPDGRQYLNLRAQLWFTMADWFTARDCKIPANDETLISELVAPRYEYTSNGKIKIESKDDMKRKRGLPSPDAADAFMLTFASTPSRLAHGSKSGSRASLLAEWSPPYG